MLKISAVYDLNTAKFKDIRRKSLLRCLVLQPESMVDELGMISTQMGMHNRSLNGRCAWEAFYDTTP
jgi:hypothetical protein